MSPGNCSPSIVGQGVAVWYAATDPRISKLRDPRMELASFTRGDFIGALAFAVAIFLLLIQRAPRLFAPKR